MTITLRPITGDNWIECIALAPTEEQQRIGFVSPNQLSLAQAYAERWWQPYGIYADETIVGFVLYGRWPATGVSPHHTAAEPGVHHVLRFMIDARYQGRGYGRAGMERVIEQIKAEPGAHAITISYDPSNTVMARLCAGAGFEPTGRLIDDEIEARLSI
ncbi:MAG: diadenosine tetraphosphatase [Chloroflexi bacterium]|nr:MAG: diadenosine tetraphosphatase [Chloroflexota bacterium]